jgi:hypothetical protein
MYWEEGKKPADCLLERIEKVRAEGNEGKKPAWPD